MEILDGSDHRFHRNIIGLGWVISKFLFKHDITVTKGREKINLSYMAFSALLPVSQEKLLKLKLINPYKK